MKTQYTKRLTILFLIFSSLSVSAQNVYDIDFDTMHFGGGISQVSNYPGTSNGTAQGDVTLYQNVAVVDGDTIDCYVITKSVSSGTNISNIDKQATTGSTGSIIEDRFFAPQMTFPSGTASGPGGEVEFELHFIEHGTFSFNSATGVASGTAVVLTNVRMNAYDIDGNSNQYSNEYIQLKDFAFSELDENTTVAVSYDHNTRFTSFYSLSHLKNMDATDDKYRVVVNYDSISVIDIHVLSGSTNYVFIDFGPGLPYSNNPINYYRVSGTLYDDGNGLTDNQINGSGIGTINSNNLYAVLLKSDTVIRVETINANGNFVFPAVKQETYDIQLATTAPSIGATNIDPSVPSGWEFIGEKHGTGSGTDGTVDGILPNISVSGGTVTACNFGINALPVADDHSHTIATPLWNSLFNIGALGTSTLSGSDFEDGNKGSGDRIAITSLPANGNELWYSGTKISTASAASPYVISSYNPLLLSVKFLGNLTTGLSFDYVVYDEAGSADPSPATYNLTWNNPLPVKLIAFSVDYQGGEVQLDWVTASEYNNDHFVVERRIGQVLEPVAKVAGAGNSSDLISYSYVDSDLKDYSGHLEYRLAQYDYNGQVSYSAWNPIYIQGDEQVSLYPNPVKSKLTISVKQSWIGSKVEINDLSGRILQSHAINKETSSITLNDLEPGHYFVRIIQRDRVLTERIQIK